MMRLTIAAAVIAAAFALSACTNPAAPQGNYGTIAGTITSTAGQPVAGVILVIDYTISVTTGPDGKYSFTSVPLAPPGAPARVEVTTVPSGYQVPPPRTDVQVQVNQTTVVNFVLSPG
jgi:hypothetical protein